MKGPWTIAVALLAAVSAAAGQAGGEGGLPSGFEQLIPRGAIEAIDDPRFVTAGEAEIPGDAWVLGVVIGGEARAYSLNILNHHEIVNDRVGGKAIAAAW